MPLEHAGCTICGAPRDRLIVTVGDRRCKVCGSLSGDRVLHAVLAGELHNEVKLDGARTLLVGVNSCQASHVFFETEQYRCDCVEGPLVDLIAKPSQLASLPDACFDGVVLSDTLVTGGELEPTLDELCRVLMPNGWMLVLMPVAASGGSALVHQLERRIALQRLRGTDPSTRRTFQLFLGRKAGAPLGPQPTAPDELVGYAYHLSRKTGRRIVFCLDGPIAAGDRLPVKSLSDEIVGYVTISSYNGGRTVPPEPWSEGFRLPPRATFELDPTLPSGVYILDGKIPFVHRSDSSASIAVLIPSNTAVAFNDAGGRSLYDRPGHPSADVLSFHRPLRPLVLLERTAPFARWFESEGPAPGETTYLIDSDLEEEGALDEIEVLIVIGRSEYWTRGMRESFDRYVDRGGHALLLCSELMYWQVRLDLDAHRMYRYKEVDPHPDPLMRTTVWHHPSLKYPIYPRTGCELWHGGFSADSEGIGWGGMRILCPESPLLDGVSLQAGDVVHLPDASVWDGAPVKQSGNGVIEVDFGDTPPWRHEVIGYNLVRPLEESKISANYATSLWLVLRHAPESGTVVHCGTLGWCGPCAVGMSNQNSTKIRTIILQMVHILLDSTWPFTSNV